MYSLLTQMLLSISLLASLSRCDSQEVQSRQDLLASCNDRAYTATDSFNNVEGVIIKRVRTGPTPTTTLWYIEAPKVVNWMPIAPCNLPEKAKQDGLKVKFSGHLVTYPGLERINVEALPFELTSITSLVPDK